MKKQMKSIIQKRKQRIILAVTGILLLVAFVPNQVTAQYILDDKVSFVYINGTSTLHDWTANVEQMKGSLQAEVKDNHFIKINSTKITIPVISLKSGKEAMDKNMYKALNEDAYPEIVYQLKSNIIHNGTITVKGELTIAGVTKTVETKITQEEAGKHIKINGEVKLKMSDFNIKPPEFLLGAFKTGDDISITFHFMFCEKN